MQILNNNSTPDDTYFDEAYFERGWERGTAYSNYRESAATSAVFRTVAEALTAAFAPKKSLEIGCATGAIVSHMNDLNVEGFGIDVSEWAVANAIHPNVRLASAAELPFEDSTFDLVYSSHALEHLPDHIYATAFREINRVCSPDAVQFHMLPIVGTYPYDYDEETVVRNLKADPTHVLLKRMTWWLDQWAALGWVSVPQNILLPDDTDNVELSSGQFCLVRKDSDAGRRVQQGINEWNGVAFRNLMFDRRKKATNQRHVTQISKVAGPFAALGHANDTWVDLRHTLSTPKDFKGAIFDGIVSNEADTEVPLRIALLSQTGDVVEKWFTFAPGTSIIKIDVEDFEIESGAGNISSISEVYFGGNIGNFRFSANIAIRSPNFQIEGLFD